MAPISEKLRWVASEPTASALAKKITTINKQAWNLLSLLKEDQVIGLIMMIEESIEDFSSSVNIKPEYGKVSSLDLFKGFYNSMTCNIDEEIFENYNVPDDLDVLQVFAALAASKASYALEFLAGRNITTAHVENFGSVEAAATALAADSAIEAAEALAVGYAEFKRTHEFITAEEGMELKHAGQKKGGDTNSKKWLPLREKAFQLYDDLAAKKDSPIGHYTAAKLIRDDVWAFAVEKGFYKEEDEIDETYGEREELSVKTLYRWFNEAEKKQEWQKIFVRMQELDED